MGLNVSDKGTVLTFGELLLRLSPDNKGNWLNNKQTAVHVGGAELNVATALALWGINAKYFTALPDNGLTQQLIDYIGGRGVVTSAIFKTGKRLGLFYLTTGADMKHDAVIYDREGSAFAGLKPGMVNWDEVLKGVSWFHFSAICPAVSEQAAAVCEEVLKAASQRGITISVDLNYRAKLWQYGVHPHNVMPRLIKYCNLVMGNIWAAESLLGIAINKQLQNTTTKKAYLEEALKSSEKIMQLYPACKAIANTFRFNNGSGINYYTALYEGEKLYSSGEYNAEKVVDKVGSGDCFMAGLIYGYYHKLGPAETVNFAAAAAFEKLFIEGDATKSTVEQVINAIKYDN